MAQLSCTNCNYKMQLDRVPEKCPYCGANGTVRKNQDMYSETLRENRVGRISSKK